MDFGHYNDLAVLAAADLVNTVGSITGTDFMDTPELAGEFLTTRGFSDSAILSSGDLEELHRIRERLRAVFFAQEESEGADLINGLLDDLAAKPYLTDHDGHWHLHYAPGDASIARRAGAAMAMGLATLIAEHGFARLGICSADDCRDVFVDTSRNRSRRFCSDGCSSRTNVAAFRARRRSETT